MKKVLIVLFAITSLAAQAQVLAPAGSPGAVTSTVVGLTDVKIEYSRPKAKGRKIFGAGADFVVPYGQMWRSGANTGTLITFSDNVKFGGSDVPKGTYKLYSIAGPAEWTVILTKDLTLAGNDPAEYKKENDAARVTVKSEKLTEKVETFTLQITDLSDDSKTANLQISWENISVKAPITVDFDKKVMASIDASTKINPNNLFNAANYYFESGKDNKQALEWVNTAIAARPDAYWMIHVKAKIQKAMGDKKGATESAMSSKTIATKDNDAAYVKMNDELLKSLK